MSILSLFTITLNFLKDQTDPLKFKENWTTIAAYDLSNIESTKEDEVSLLSSESNSVLEKTEEVNSDLELKNDSDNSLWSSLIKNEKNITVLDSRFEEKIKEKEKKESQLAKIIDEKAKFQKILSEIRNKKIEIFKEYDRIDLTVKGNLSELIKNARKWWHWPLKFFTCGMWESKEIRKINKDYISRKFHKKLTTKKRNDLIVISENITNLSYEIDKFYNELKPKPNKLLNRNEW